MNKKIPILTIEEVADELGVSKMSIYRYVRAGLLPCRRIGGGRLMRFTVNDIKIFLNRSKQDLYQIPASQLT